MFFTIRAHSIYLYHLCLIKIHSNTWKFVASITKSEK